MGEDKINCRRMVFVGIVVVGCGVLRLFFAEAEIVVLVVSRDFGSAPRTESDITQLRCASTGCGRLELLPVFLRKGTSTLSSVCIVFL